MQKTELFGSLIEYDPVATSIGYDDVPQPDPTCCDACAAFTDIVLHERLPPAFSDALGTLGIDPTKPQEVYGIPGLGVLAGWYLFVGRLTVVWSGAAEDAFEEVSPGLRCWITDRLVVHSWPDVPAKLGLVQIEFDWKDAGLITSEQF